MFYLLPYSTFSDIFTKRSPDNFIWH